MQGENSVITLLLTDIEGSTRLWEEDPQAMARALVLHDEVAQAVISAHGGTLVKPRGEGDSLFIVFESPLAAVQCAAALQFELASMQWPTSRPIRARMSVHTGAANHWEGDYYGQTVNRCARIRGVGHGGQVLVSQATALITENDLPSPLSLQDMGQHRLKDLAQAERIFQLCHPDLTAEFAPLSSLALDATNLPIQVSSFVGRAAELKVIKDLLAKHALVSLVALSGMGKSRLALQAAADMADTFADGAWHLDATFIEPDRFLESLASLFSIEPKGPDDFASLVNALKAKQVLIVVDNIELNGPEILSAVQKVLSNCPRVRFLVTAHSRLGITGEALFSVPELPCPPSQTRSVREIEQSDAVRLFVERAQLVVPSFTLTSENAPGIATIVGQLDGHPLGVELAAARLKAMSLGELTKRIQKDLRVVGAGAAGPIANILEWAYESLGVREKTLLCRLAVFHGRFSLAAAEAIATHGDIEEWEVLDLLGMLVDQGLVQFQDADDVSTYRLLKPVADFASKRSGSELEEPASRHAHFYESQAIESSATLETTDFKAYMRQIEYSIDNVRAALHWLTRYEPKRLVSICPALFRYWEAKGLNVEGRMWCDTAVALWPLEDVTKQLGETLNSAACLAGRVGDYEAARPLHQRALAIREQLDDRVGVAGSLNNLANIENESGNLAAAKDLYERAIELNRELGNVRYVAINLVNLGTTAHRLGDYDAALEWHQQSIDAFTQLGSRAGRLYPLASRGNSLCSVGRFDEAEVAFMEAAKLCQEVDDRPWLCICLEGMAQVALHRKQLDGFGQRMGAAEQLRAEVDLPKSPSDEAENAEWMRIAREMWSDSDISQAIRRGSEMGWRNVAEGLL